MEQITITVKYNDGIKIISAQKGDNLLKVLEAADITVKHSCPGGGICKKCKVDIIDPNGNMTILACQYEVIADCSVFVP